MTMLDTSILSQSMPERGTEPLAPEIKILEETETYGRFAFEPLERGYGITVGNPMRRMLLSSIEGDIEGASKQHGGHIPGRKKSRKDLAK